MKIRNDFVTNSSSASFILGMKEDFNEYQKEEILSYIKRNIFGRVVLTPDSTEEEIQKFIDDYYIDDYEIDEIRKALNKGQSIHYGTVDFECENNIAEIYDDIWSIMRDHDNFTAIDDNLDY